MLLEREERDMANRGLHFLSRGIYIARGSWDLLRKLGFAEEAGIC